MSYLKSIFCVAAVLLSTASIAGGKTVVTDIPSYQQAIIQACEGQSVGAQCTIEFTGGQVSIGVCVNVPGNVGGQLTCSIDTSKISNCKNNTVAMPGFIAMFAAAFGALFFFRRRRA